MKQVSPLGTAALSPTEERFAANNKTDAVEEAERAEKLLPKKGVAHERAVEIRREAKGLDESD